MTTATRTEPSGWVLFAATVLWVVAAFNIIYGLVILFNSDWVVLTSAGLLVFDLTSWGWILLLTGVIQAAVGVGVFEGLMWARVLGIIMAGLSAISMLSIMSVYPMWGITILAINVFVIYALTVHGSETATA